MNNILRILLTHKYTDDSLQVTSSDCRYAKHVIGTSNVQLTHSI
jgi:hypothetical protein